jgi:hypothetical protein
MTDHPIHKAARMVAATKRTNPDYSTMVPNPTIIAASETIRDLTAKLEEALEQVSQEALNGGRIEAERDQLQRFKEYVHQRLDEAGVTGYPEGKHSKAGCRVGDRLDELVGQRDAMLGALIHVYKFIASEYGDPESQSMDGHHVSKEARAVWDVICGAMSGATVARKPNHLQAVKAALSPLARWPMGGEIEDDLGLVLHHSSWHSITVGDVMAARAALAKLLEDES